MALDYFATQAGNYSAEVTRRAMFAWAARTATNAPGIIAGGLMSPTDLQVTAPASGMTVNIGVGEGLIGGNEGGSQGGYYFRNSATYSATVATANGSLPRIDAVVATMADGGYTEPSDAGGTSNGPVIAVVTGTPTSGATLSNLSGAPALPGSSLLLAWLLVPAAATNIISGDISNVAQVATPQFFGTSGLADGQPLVYNGTTNQWRTLPAGGANATFLQLLSAQKLQFAFGTCTFSWGGSSAVTSNVTVTHGLGRVPQLTSCLCSGISSSISVSASLGAASTTTQATFFAGAIGGTPTTGQTATGYWFAIG